jgi:putative hemolysin
MCNKLVLLVISAMVVLALAACGKPQPETVVEPEGPIGIPNPAAVYCTGLGYEYTTRERKID